MGHLPVNSAIPISPGVVINFYSMGSPRPRLKLEPGRLSMVQRERKEEQRGEMTWRWSHHGRDGSRTLVSRSAWAHCVANDVLCLVLQQG